jgi:cell wall assembly regulator SMI1
MKAIITLFFLSSITIWAQGQIKPPSPVAKIQSNMKAIIGKIDAHLQKNEPVVYKSLNPPLTPEQIHALELKHKVTLPADLKEIYLWKNGQNLEGDYKSFFGNKTLLTLEQALEIREELNSMLLAKNTEEEFKIPNWWSVNWIPVFENGGGDYLCYDVAGIFTGNKGQVLDYYHSETYRMVNAPSLVLYLEALQRVYDKKHEDEWDSLKEIGNYPKSYKLKEDE